MNAYIVTKGVAKKQGPQKIFTPFESGKNKFGTGLGMPIAKQVIDQHKGRIEIESKEGKGATFKIFLPAKVVE